MYQYTTGRAEAPKDAGPLGLRLAATR